MAGWDEYSQYEGENAEIAEETPRILLMGPRRSGKSSMSEVVFHKMPAHETLFIQNTNTLDIKYIANNAFVQFQIWDFPGDFDFSQGELVYGGQLISPQVVFSACAALVFVIDAQDEPYQDALIRLVKTVSLAQSMNPNIVFEVFIHKVDGDLFLTDEQKIDCQHEIQKFVIDELAEAQLDIHLSFYLTSIYDHTIFEAFSKVVQKLMPQLPTLENLLNILISNCNMEKSFLFDVVSKIYIATDSNPVDMQSYELCSDMIDVVIDVSCIYGIDDNGGNGRLISGELDNSGSTTATGGAVAGSGGGDGSGGIGGGGMGGEGGAVPLGESFDGLGEGGAGAAPYDAESSSVIRLSNGMVLYLREVNNYLALVCLLRGDNLQKRGLIDYNIDCFKQALSQVFVPRSSIARHEG